MTGYLIAARALQGAGGAMMVPLSLTLLSAAVGPLVGGAVVQGVLWRSIFWLNVRSALPWSRWCASDWRSREAARESSTCPKSLSPAGSSTASSGAAASAGRAARRAAGLARPRLGRAGGGGDASGANNAVRELGGVLGIAVLGAVFSGFGGDASGATLVAGLLPAVWFGTAVVGAGAVLALFLTRAGAPLDPSSPALSGSSSKPPDRFDGRIPT